MKVAAVPVGGGRARAGLEIEHSERSSRVAISRAGRRPPAHRAAPGNDYQRLVRHGLVDDGGDLAGHGLPREVLAYACAHSRRAGRATHRVGDSLA